MLTKFEIPGYGSLSVYGSDIMANAKHIICESIISAACESLSFF